MLAVADNEHEGVGYMDLRVIAPTRTSLGTFVEGTGGIFDAEEALDVFVEDFEVIDGVYHGRASQGRVAFEVIFRTADGRFVHRRFNGGDYYRYVESEWAADWLLRAGLVEEHRETFPYQKENSGANVRTDLEHPDIGVPDFLWRLVEQAAEAKSMSTDEFVYLALTRYLESAAVEVRGGED